MIEKLQKIIFAGIIVFLPSQFGLHLWPEWAFINGVRIDYFSPTLYFTDCLIIGLFITVIPDLIRDPYRFRVKPGMTLVYCITGLLVLLNIYFSLSPAVTIHKWIKVLEFGFLINWIIHFKFQISNFKLLIIPIIYSCLLALWQYFNHGSVGGLWYFLGERTFTFDTPGIAPNRPYATFPHPNVLMGFLTVSGLVLLKYFPHISRKITALVLLLVLVVLFLLPSRGDFLNGWSLRMQLNNIAIQQFINSPIIGTGLGTSPLYPRNITNYALLHQPIHNIYLLILSETGIIGFGGLLFIIFKVLKTQITMIHASIFLILFLGLFDHYWLTLQQTQLLLSIIVGWLLYQKKSP